MSDLYWYFEYGKVLAAYTALFCIWPSVMFRSYLRGKGLTFRFLFCVTVPVVLYNGVILGLGLLHILNMWLVRILFYGVFLVSVSLPLFRQKPAGAVLNTLLTENPMLRRSLKMRLACRWEEALKKGKAFCLNYRSRWVECAILAVLLFFGMAFFSLPPLLNHAYGNYDAHTHTMWLQGMLGGEIFPEGIYPQAMHCFIYSMRVLFGVKIYSCLLYLAGIHSVVFLLALYCLLRELFLCRYTPLFVLTLFLTFDGCIIGEASKGAELSTSRFSWTLPQEFGWYLAFLCPFLLLRYFREKDRDRTAGRWFQDENLLLLAAAVAATIAVHFYVTMLAFFLCLLVALLHVRKLLRVKEFVPLFCAAWDGLIAGALPMLTAFILGEEMEKSLRWGINTLQGKTGAAAEMIATQKAEVVQKNAGILDGLYEKGYAAIFGEYGGLAAALVLLIPLALGCLWIYCHYPRRGQRRNRVPVLTWEQCSGYLFIAAASVLMVFLYAAPFMNLPEFISVDRLFVMMKALVYAVPWGLVDAFLFLAVSGRYETVIRRGAVVVCLGVYCFSGLVDFHRYGFWLLMRHESEVRVTAAIVDRFEPGTFKIISMGDERSQVEDTRHCVQILDFIQGVEERDFYTLPAEYVFLYVEKHPIKVGSTQFFTGPAWLGRKSESCNNVECNRWYPDVIAGSISEDAANYVITDYGKVREGFNGYFWERIRKALYSKAYYWYQDFSEAHPAETNIYYEDEDFVCYVIHQNPEAPLNLVMRG